MQLMIGVYDFPARACEKSEHPETPEMFVERVAGSD
jgi:hypothetical protein